jgi:hypothetical protein
MLKRRFLVRSLWLGGALLPAIAMVTYGCESATQFDDLCSWVSDPDNCYANFFEDIQTQCGSAAEPRLGTFAARDKLDLCFLDQGGLIRFDPPLNLEVPIEESPDPFNFEIVNPDTTVCGNIGFIAKYDFSVSIIGDEIPDGGTPQEGDIVGGTFSMSGGKASDSLAVKCPLNVAAFNFDRLQITKCPQYEAILPHAEIDFNPGGVEQTGIIRLRVYYPPLEGELANAAPIPITYFECVIPAAPPPCENMVQDGVETDVDCGGGFCSAKCGDGQKCQTDADCVSSVCEVVEGIRKCIGPMN